MGEVVERSATVSRNRSLSPSRPRRPQQNSSMVAGSSRSRRVATWYINEVLATSVACLVDVLRRRNRGAARIVSHSSAPRLGVVLARPAGVGPTLAHVVQKRRQEERPRAGNLRCEAGGERVVVRELAARELAKAVDRRHRVNVDRVHMVDVVVYATGDGEKLRHHRQEQADVVELADHRTAPGLASPATVATSSTKSAAPSRSPATARTRRIRRGTGDGIARERQKRRAMAHAAA